MATTKTNSTNLFETMVETQNKMMETMVEKTKEFTKDIPLVKETIEKSTEAYNKTLAAQKELLKEATAKFEAAKETSKKTAESTKTYFEKWLETQKESSTNMFKNFTTGFATPTTPNFTANPTEMMQNMQNYMTEMANKMQTMATQMNVMNMMQNNPFTDTNNPMAQMFTTNNMQTQMQEGMNNWTKYTKEYFDKATTLNPEWSKYMPNITSAESFKGMHNMTESFSKFYEMMAPMFKSMENKTFTMDTYKEMMNPAMQKEFMDKFYSFMPTEQKQMMEQMNQAFVTNMKKMSTMGADSFATMKNTMATMPGMDVNPFQQTLDMYNQVKTAINTSISPLTTLMQDNHSIKDLQTWDALSDKMLELSIKNNELQFMLYNTGNKAMELMAQSISDKIENGQDIESIVALYKEYLLKGDTAFTSLFESDAYSKLMTEVSSLQMQIQKEIDTQMEKTIFGKMPVATRTEMDEVYKNIYDLKKVVRAMEKIMGETTTTPTAKTTTTKTKSTPSTTATAKTATKTAPTKTATVATKTATKPVAKKTITKKK